MRENTTVPAGHNDDWPHNPIAAAGAAFAWLTAGPHPVTVNGRLFDYLPDRDIPVDELRRLLLKPSCPRAVWDQVWSHIVNKARMCGDGTWKIVAVGLALPALSTISTRLTADFADDPHDICAEVLRGFLDALARVNLDQGRIVARLRWAAYRAGHRALLAAMDGPTPVPPGFGSHPPTPPFGHPDLVLARAVSTGVLSTAEAELIGETRLADVTLAEWAAAYNLSYSQVQRARHRAERRVAIWLAATSEQPDRGDPTAADALNGRLRPVLAATASVETTAIQKSPQPSV